MKRIEDIKKFEDIDTYYEISKIVDEVFQDRVEAHKHLVTANKEIERLNKENEELKKIQCTFLGTGCKAEIERLNNIINELEEYIENNSQYDDNIDNYWTTTNELLEILGSDKK